MDSKPKAVEPKRNGMIARCAFAKCNAPLIPRPGASTTLIRYDKEANEMIRGWRVQFYCAACRTDYFRIIELIRLPDEPVPAVPSKPVLH